MQESLFVSHKHIHFHSFNLSLLKYVSMLKLGDIMRSASSATLFGNSSHLTQAAIASGKPPVLLEAQVPSFLCVLLLYCGLSSHISQQTSSFTMLLAVGKPKGPMLSTMLEPQVLPSFFFVLMYVVFGSSLLIFHYTLPLLLCLLQ
jgi:hypothetical protein